MISLVLFAGGWFASLPTQQKRLQIFLHHLSRRLKLSVATAVEQAAISAQNDNHGHAFIQSSLVLLDQILILIAFANINVHDEKTLFDYFAGGPFVQRAIEHVTVVTPVSA